MNYYVSRNGRVFGPYTFEDLQKYVRSADISPADLGQKQGEQQWIPVGQILSGVSSPVVAPPPQPPAYGGYYPPQAQYSQTTVNYYAPRPKNRASFILLGVFFGCFGGHNFYAGYTGKAIAQLLVTLLSLFTLSIVTAIWAIVEVCTVDRDRNNIPMI
jgi:TM2 domain-containing membrane protein YozV